MISSERRAMRQKAGMFNATDDVWAIPRGLRDMVDREMDQGEQLVWAGQPNPRRFVLRALPTMLFAIPWTAFAIFWMWGASGFGEPSDMSWPRSMFALFGLPFVLIGLGMLSAPLWAIRKARRTVYAVTDRRAILFLGGWGTTVRSFGPDRMGGLRRRQRADGSGDILFEPSPPFADGAHSRMAEGSFFGIANVKEVESLLRDLADKHALATGPPATPS